MTQSEPWKGPLSGVRVLDIGRFIAGPVAATILAEFGADVIKVERPVVGDDLRRLGWQHEGKSLWWSVEARNKRSITLDLRHFKGKAAFKRLVAVSDVVVENFRAGTLERWNLGWSDLEPINPGLIMLRTSGFGQEGPKRESRAFNTTAEAFGGLRYLIGDPGKPPARPGIALGDYAGALFGAIGVLVALYHRDCGREAQGQEIDNALYEGVMRLIEYTISAYGHTGRVRERVGPGSAGTVPARSFLSQDGKWLALSAASDKSFRCLCSAIGRDDLADDPRYVTNEVRIVNVDSLNAILEDFMAGVTAADALALFDQADVPAVLVYSAADLVADDHIVQRGSIVTVPDAELGQTMMQGVAPLLGRTPGRVVHAGPSLGEHNHEVYNELLSMSTDEIDALAEEGII